MFNRATSHMGGKGGEYFEEERTGAHRYTVTIPRENGDGSIQWHLQLPEISIDADTPEEKARLVNQTFKPFIASLRECAAAFFPSKQADWTDKEYAALKKSIGSLLWDPPAEWLNAMHVTIAQRLDIEDYKNLECYPTHGTAADIHHGIDEFLIYTTREGRRILITIDYSTLKKEKFKADVLITETGAFINPDHFAINPHLSFDVPDLEHANSAEAKQRLKLRRETMANAIAIVCDCKQRELGVDQRRSYDGHYDIYPLERSILPAVKTQMQSANRLKGLTFLSRQTVDALFSEGEDDLPNGGRKKKRVGRR